MSLAATTWITMTAILPMAISADWPQILGPNRDGVISGESLEPWSAKGPQEQWSVAVGAGNAGPVIRDSKLVIYQHETGEDSVICLEVKTGKQVWKKAFRSSGDAPHCTPVWEKEALVLLGNDGVLRCLQPATGDEIWSHSLLKEFKAPAGYFGVGSTPVVEGGNVIVNVGNKNGAGIVAFSLTDGKVVWKATDELASYSSPVAVTQDGVRHVLMITRMHLLSVDPATGKTRFTKPFGKMGPTVNAATPVVAGNHVFLTANYGIGAAWCQFTADTIQTIWENDDSLSSQYPTPIYCDGYLYGNHGRDDVGVAEFRCIEAKTGKVMWSEADFGMAACLRAKDLLLILKTDGTLLLAPASATGFRPLAKAKISEQLVRALPAYADGKLYVRDAKSVKCWSW